MCAMNPRLLRPLASGIDPAVGAWRSAVLAAGSSVNGSVVKAVDEFVRGCKADGIWDAIKACCVLCGPDTIDGALVPLVGAAPTPYNFAGSDYDRLTGLVGDGSTTYLDSNRANDADPQDDKHISVYATNLGSDGGAMRGLIFAGSGGVSGSSGIGYRASDGLSPFQVNNATSTFAAGVTTGFLGASRSSSTEFIYRQNNSDATASQPSQSPIATNVLLYSRIGNITSARLAFYSIGESLDLEALDTRVSALITAIGAS
jgi:hypothetical protein